MSVIWRRIWNPTWHKTSEALNVYILLRLLRTRIGILMGAVRKQFGDRQKRLFTGNALMSACGIPEWYYAAWDTISKECGRRLRFMDAMAVLISFHPVTTYRARFGIDGIMFSARTESSVWPYLKLIKYERTLRTMKYSKGQIFKKQYRNEKISIIEIGFREYIYYEYSCNSTIYVFAKIHPETNTEPNNRNTSLKKNRSFFW